MLHSLARSQGLVYMDLLHDAEVLKYFQRFEVCQ